MIFESNSPESVRNLIAAGLGIGFWPERSWDEQPGPQVKLIPIRYPVCRRDVVDDHVQAGTGEAGSGRVCGLSVRVF